MRRFNVQVIVNATTAGWGDKLQAVADFYESVCDLRFTTLRSSYSNIPFSDVVGRLPFRQVEQGFYNREISGRYPGADIVIFILAPGDRGSNITPAGVMTFNDPHAYEITLFGTFGEKDHTYQNGKDLGDATTLFLCHELSHVFYSMLGKRDDTHLHFITNGHPGWVTADFADLNAEAVQVSYLQRFVAFLQAYIRRTWGVQPATVTIIDHEPAPVVPVAPKSKIQAWALAIQHAEGGKIQDLNTRNKNPGNLKYTTLTASLGGKQSAPTADGRVFCYFDTYEQGFKALCDFLTLACTNKLKAYRGMMTLEAFTKIYAEPPRTNADPLGRNYVNSVATRLGVPITIPIVNLL